ncbi:MAG: right-handed parallel beta-helix repeat-containing protein [Tannerellaceae bacterium]|jgi:hypothetical protein|nr:right-handed parallel beta-helix repeat-containing protein [Tannerellaceae bacterium]
MKANAFLFFLALLIPGILPLCGQSQTYFISPEGSDANSGLSIKTAWKTLEKVNSRVFQPGDRILFRSGAVWKGQLQPQGSGARDLPIRLSSFGGEAPAVIHTGRAEGAAIRLVNQSWWEIENMEITSGAQPEAGIGRQGIVATYQGGDYEHLVVRNCYIHDLWGQLGGNTEYTGYGSCGILVQTQGRRMAGATTSLSDVRIENNRIVRMDKVAIRVNGCQNGMVIRKNYMENLGGDGIIAGGCYRGLVEYNVAKRTCLRSGYQDLSEEGLKWWPHTAAIWLQNAEETVMQYNEVYDTGRQPGNGDGFAYDFDFYCVRCVAQYNYSRNNHGFMLLMNRTFENVSRYNISENDQTHLVQMQCDISERNIFYNNIFYINYGTVDLDFFLGDGGTNSPQAIGAAYHNNIFYATGQSYFRTAYSRGETLTRTFDETTRPATGSWNRLFFHNCYFGPWKNGIPDDPEKITEDPLFLQPGSGGEGLCSLEGYRLQSNSPLINKGIYIPLNGERDFWGNPLSDGQADIGAYEQIGSGARADASQISAANERYRKESAMAWAKWSFPLQIQLTETAREIVIRPLKPLQESIKGSITWTDAKGVATTLMLEKQKQRDVFTLKVKADKASLLASTVHVNLKYDNLEETWNIPIVERAGRNN